jgi:hypothetical protein
LNAERSTNISSRGISTGSNADCALRILLFYDASAFGSDAYLMNRLHGRFLGNKCSDEHICFVIDCIIEVKDV